MANTEFVKLPLLSSKIYKEWHPKTVLVQSCDDSFEGELNLETRELDIPVYHDLSLHQTTIKERELKPAPIEFIKASTKRVTIDKGRYSHWGQTTLGQLINKLSAEDSIVREKLVKKWAIEAERELAEWCAFSLGASQTINIPTILSWSTTGFLDKDNILKVLDILKAHAIRKNMEPSEFKLFVSEAFETILRDTKINLGANLDANEAFRAGFVAIANGVDIRKIQVASITTRNSGSGLVEAEYAIWKTRDGIQYVVPYKNTVSYDIQPTEVLLGGKGYQTVEYYDFFNLYPTRLFRVPLYYKANPTLPTL
jgi:hypothetical protein